MAEALYDHRYLSNQFCSQQTVWYSKKERERGVIWPEMCQVVLLMFKKESLAIFGRRSASPKEAKVESAFSRSASRPAPKDLTSPAVSLFFPSAESLLSLLFKYPDSLATLYRIANFITPLLKIHSFLCPAFGLGIAVGKLCLPRDCQNG